MVTEKILNRSEKQQISKQTKHGTVIKSGLLKNACDGDGVMETKIDSIVWTDI